MTGLEAILLVGASTVSAAPVLTSSPRERRRRRVAFCRARSYGYRTYRSLPRGASEGRSSPSKSCQCSRCTDGEARGERAVNRSARILCGCPTAIALIASPTAK